MSKDWDKDKGGRDSWVSWMTAVMEECLRVIKPGGHMLCWSIPRTSHWTAWAIESAGFEIRDRIDRLFSPQDQQRQFIASLDEEQQELFARAFGGDSSVLHVVGSGFPKNMDVSKAIDKHFFHVWLKEHKEKKQQLYDAKKAVQVARKTKDKALIKECLAAHDDLEKSLQQEAGTYREVICKNPNKEGRHYDIKGGHYNDSVYQEDGVEAFITQAATPEAQQYEGYGLALKPTSEIWWLARKPLIGSVAENVLEHGTGALNIDSCRISLNGEKSTAAARRQSKPVINYEQEGSWPNRTSPETYKQSSAGELKGRWPSHLILTHHPECVCKGTKKVQGERTRGLTDTPARSWANESIDGINRVGHGSADGTEEVEDYICHEQCPIRILGEQSGITKSGARDGRKKPHDGLETFQQREHDTGENFPASVGTASRFFLNLESSPPFIYIPKASRSEKEDGLEERNGKKVNNGRETPIDTPYQRGETKRLNTHPTVKSLRLMRYLVRLITPPDGVVLDPFTGSGSTGVAALLEGFRFFGIEKQEEYVDIAKERIEAAKQQVEFDALGSLEKARQMIQEKTKKEAKGQTSIFDFMGKDGEG